MSKSQIAALVADIFSNVAVAENKVRKLHRYVSVCGIALHLLTIDRINAHSPKDIYSTRTSKVLNSGHAYMHI